MYGSTINVDILQLIAKMCDYNKRIERHILNLNNNHFDQHDDYLNEAINMRKEIEIKLIKDETNLN